MRRKRIRGASSIMFGGLLDSPYSDHKYLRPSSKATGSWNQKRNEYLYMWTQNITVQQWARAARMQPLSTDSALDNTPAWHIPSYCHAVVTGWQVVHSGTCAWMHNLSEYSCCQSYPQYSQWLWRVQQTLGTSSVKDMIKKVNLCNIVDLSKKYIFITNSNFYSLLIIA